MRTIALVSNRATWRVSRARGAPQLHGRARVLCGWGGPGRTLSLSSGATAVRLSAPAIPPAKRLRAMPSPVRAFGLLRARSADECAAKELRRAWPCADHRSAAVAGAAPIAACCSLPGPPKAAATRVAAAPPHRRVGRCLRADNTAQGQGASWRWPNGCARSRGLTRLGNACCQAITRESIWHMDRVGTSRSWARGCASMYCGAAPPALGGLRIASFAL